MPLKIVEFGWIFTNIFILERCQIKSIIKYYFVTTLIAFSIFLLYTYWARPCEKTGPKNQKFKPVVSENKSLVKKK